MFIVYTHSLTLTPTLTSVQRTSVNEWVSLEKWNGESVWQNAFHHNPSVVMVGGGAGMQSESTDLLLFDNCDKMNDESFLSLTRREMQFIILHPLTFYIVLYNRFSGCAAPFFSLFLCTAILPFHFQSPFVCARAIASFVFHHQLYLFWMDIALPCLAFANHTLREGYQQFYNDFIGVNVCVCTIYTQTRIL